jgi:acyl-coenzyme A synthetase/AMP-(fatty) acid ligase
MSTFYDFIFGEKKDWDKEILITNINRYSILDLHSKVDEFIRILQQEGDLKGKKIGVLTPNIFDYFSLIIAVNKLGGTLIPLSHQYRNEDLTKVLDFIRPNIIFTVEEANGTPLKKMICEWIKNKNIFSTIFTFYGNEITKEVVLGKEEPLLTEEIDLIACTSGSTGVPKGVKLSVNSVEKWTNALISGVELKANDQIFLTIPITAPYGICWLLTCFQKRIQMVIPERFDMPIVLNLLKENHCNKIATTPSIFKAIYLFAKQLNPTSLNRIKLGFLAGEQIGDEFISLMMEFRGCRLINNYGLSEQGVLMFTNDIRNEVVEWTIAKGNHYKVRDISTDGVGELMINTQFGFDGYYLNEEMTCDALTIDGWFYTGDLVRMKEQGKIQFVGRKKQMIKKGGVQVIPGEVETVLNKHPKVIQSAVVGIPHSVYGEDIVGFILAEEDINLDELFTFAREKIATYKMPGRIIKINEMPIIQGKLDKITLRKMAMNS